MPKQRKVPLTAGQDIRRAIRTFLTPGVEQFDKFIAELRKHCIVEIACKKVGLNPDIITNHYENGKAILTDPTRLSKIEYIKNLDDAVLVQALIDESDEPIPNADKPDILDMRLSFLWDQAIADRVSKLIELRDDLINEGEDFNRVLGGIVSPPFANAYVRNKQITLENIPRVLAQMLPKTFARQKEGGVGDQSEVLLGILKAIGRNSLTSPGSRAPMEPLKELMIGGDEATDATPQKQYPAVVLPPDE